MQTRFSAEFLCRATSGRWINGESGANGVAFDSRRVLPGDLFFALPGAARDGHEFAAAAVAAGACGVVVCRVLPDLKIPQLLVADVLAALAMIAGAHRRRFPGPVTGISGSCGKTSLKSILETLGEGRQTFVSPGNFNNEIGLPWSLCQLRPDLHRAGVFEAGINHCGEMTRLAAILQPDDTLITSVGEAHLDGLGSIEGVAREKAVLAGAARQRAFLGPSCLRYAPFQRLSQQTWGLLAEADPPPEDFQGNLVRYRIESLPAGRQRVVMKLPDAAEVALETAAVSAGLSDNLALGILYALCSGFSAREVNSRLSSWKPLEDRGLLRELGSRQVYGDYYNANPLSMEDALRHFHHLFPSAPRVWLLGSMGELGEASDAIHRRVGAAIPWQAGDEVLFSGPWAESYLQGFRHRHGSAAAHVVARADSAGDWLKQTAGPIFAKGSRAEKIESLLAYLGAE